MFGLPKTANRFLMGSVAALILGFLFVVIVAARFFTISFNSESAGFEYGKAHGAQACVDEAVKRHTVTIDPTRQLGESAFVQSCAMAAPDPEFCRDVPELNFIDQAPAVAWAESKCNEKGFNDGGCRYVYLGVINICKMRKEKR
jgi:hypothetical protein